MKTPFRSILAVLFLILAGTVSASPICPTTIENDPPATSDGCGILITIGSSLMPSILATGTGGYDGNYDSTIGVVNSSASTLAGLQILGGTASITTFSGTGIANYLSVNGVAIPPLPVLEFGYEDYYGPDTSFQMVNMASNSLQVLFTGGLRSSNSIYFSLPGDPATTAAALSSDGSVRALAETAVPEPSSFFSLAAGFLTCWLICRSRQLRIQGS